MGSASGVGAAPVGGDARAAIVKIYTIGQAADYEQAWNPGTFFSSTGSGCVIRGNRILTAAHDRLLDLLTQDANSFAPYR